MLTHHRAEAGASAIQDRSSWSLSNAHPVAFHRSTARSDQRGPANLGRSDRLSVVTYDRNSCAPPSANRRGAEGLCRVETIEV